MLKKIPTTIGAIFLVLFALHCLQAGAFQRSKAGLTINQEQLNRAIGNSLAPFDQSVRQLAPGRR